MAAMREFEARFREILAALDALAEAQRPGSAEAEALEELNAELEDALLMLGELRPDDPDRAAEARDILETLSALAGDFRALAPRLSEAAALAERLDMAARMAAANLD